MECRSSRRQARICTAERPRSTEHDLAQSVDHLRACGAVVLEVAQERPDRGNIPTRDAARVFLDFAHARLEVGAYSLRVNSCLAGLHRRWRSKLVDLVHHADRRGDRVLDSGKGTEPEIEVRRVAVDLVLPAQTPYTSPTPIARWRPSA